MGTFIFFTYKGSEGVEEGEGKGKGRDRAVEGKGKKERGRDLPEQCQTASYAPEHPPRSVTRSALYALSVL